MLYATTKNIQILKSFVFHVFFYSNFSFFLCVGLSFSLCCYCYTAQLLLHVYITPMYSINVFMQHTSRWMLWCLLTLENCYFYCAIVDVVAVVAVVTIVLKFTYFVRIHCDCKRERESVAALNMCGCT